MLPVTFLVHLLLTTEGIRFITLIFDGNFQPELINNALLFTIKIFGFMFLMGGVLQFLKVDRLMDALTQFIARFPGNKKMLNGVIQMFNIGLRLYRKREPALECVLRVRCASEFATRSIRWYRCL